METLFLSFPKFNNLIFELEFISRIKIIWLPRKIFGIDSPLKISKKGKTKETFSADRED